MRKYIYQKINKKIPAATLQETMVALTIVLICFSIALMVFVNVMRTEKSRDQLRANLLLKEVSFKTMEEQSFYNDDYERGGFIIEKLISEYQQNPSLGVLEIKVFKNNRLLIESKELFVIYDESTYE